MQSHRKKEIKSENIPPEARRLGVFEYVPSGDGVDENLLILFHGMGDTPDNYIRLAKKMKLPQTAALAIRAPDPLPFAMGWSWFPVFEFDGEYIEYDQGEQRRMDGLKKVRAALKALMGYLEKDIGWDPLHIHFLGFSQGAMVALDYILYSDTQLGGAVLICLDLLEEEIEELKSIKPALLSSSSPMEPSNSTVLVSPSTGPSTPVILLAGCKDDRVLLSQSRSQTKFLRQRMTNVEYREYEKKGHTMLGSEEEMKDVMRFFSEHLSVRQVQLEGMKGLIQIR